MQRLVHDLNAAQLASSITQLSTQQCCEAPRTVERLLMPIWLQDYYQDVNFHYQTDGWFSSDSAKVYEASTESLFLGRQDAMQRSTLVPISQCAFPPRLHAHCWYRASSFALCIMGAAH